MGKNNPLVLSKRCRFYKESSEVSNKQIFLDSLVVPAYNVRNEAILEPLSIDNTFVECSREPVVLNITVEPPSSRGSNFIEYLSGYGSCSPFPILDYHIISINRRWRDSVSIRMWKLSKDPAGRSRRITYYLAGCRYCFNIGREHRSNHVYWVVDLERFYCFQKCFDVDCRGTSSNYFPLPCFVRASIPSLKDIDEASISEGIPSLKSMRCDSTSADVKAIESIEHDARSESEIAIVRRRSAVFEKALMLKNIDSFYDEDLDEQLLTLQGNESIGNAS